MFLDGVLRIFLLNEFHEMALGRTCNLHFALLPYSATGCHTGNPNAIARS